MHEEINERSNHTDFIKGRFTSVYIHKKVLNLPLNHKIFDFQFLMDLHILRYTEHYIAIAWTSFSACDINFEASLAEELRCKKNIVDIFSYSRAVFAFSAFLFIFWKFLFCQETFSVTHLNLEFFNKPPSLWRATISSVAERFCAQNR